MECVYDIPAGMTRTAALKERIQGLQTDNASLHEIVLFLQIKSTEEAQEFLTFIRSKDTSTMSSMRQWIRNRYPEEDAPAGMLMGGLNLSSTDRMGSALLGMEFSNSDGFSSSTTASPGSSVAFGSQIEDYDQTVTVAIVQSAVENFAASTGVLCNVFTADHIDALLATSFGHIKLPLHRLFFDVLKATTDVQGKARLAELSGMAAVGILYFQNSTYDRPPPVGLAEHFYALTKRMLDSAIESDALRGMKACAVLAMYNMVPKASVALAYAELGLGLGNMHGMQDNDCPSTLSQKDFLDHKRTWRLLVLFSGWLGSCLNYRADYTSQALQLLQNDKESEEEDIIQREIIRITILKAKIMHTLPDGRGVDDSTIDGLRQELRSVYEGLPDWMAVSSLLARQDRAQLRPMIFYLHLFFLSAMELLHRRVMDNPRLFDPIFSPPSDIVKVAVKDGLVAAQTATRLLSLMEDDGTSTTICCVTIFSAYSAGLIILHAAVQNLLNTHSATQVAADLALAATCVDVLQTYAEVDSMAIAYKNALNIYIMVLKDVGRDGFGKALSEGSNGEDSVDYLFHIVRGDTDLHKASRDLLRLIRRSSFDSLELLPQSGLPDLTSCKPLVNWMEAAMGFPLDWDWGIHSRGFEGG